MTEPSDNIDIILEHITSLLTSRYDQLLLEQLGIGYSQYKILIQFEENNIVRQNIIARSLGQTEASITRQIKILIHKGLVTRSHDPKNKKTKIVTLTLLGRRVQHAAKDIITKHNHNLLIDFDNKDQLKLSSHLAVLHKQLCPVDNHNYYL